jgi:hypothetical protein
MNDAQVDLYLRMRVTPTHSGELPLSFFDGATMMTYQYPNRISEEIFCRSSPKPEYCANKHGMDPNIANVAITQLEVKLSPIPNAGRGVFFKVDAPKGTYVGADALAECLFFPPDTYWVSKLMQSYTPYHHYFRTLDSYMFGYGYANDFFGEVAYSVEPSILTFTNHGCNRTFNQGMVLPVTEMDADLDHMPDILYGNVAETYFYNPFIDRNLFLIMHVNEVTLKDVKAGDELLDNYLSYLSEENWASGVTDYRAQCALQGVGEITRYQQHKVAHDHADNIEEKEKENDDD